jgi:hypothetical protein
MNHIKYYLNLNNQYYSSDSLKVLIFFLFKSPKNVFTSFFLDKFKLYQTKLFDCLYRVLKNQPFINENFDKYWPSLTTHYNQD